MTTYTLKFDNTNASAVIVDLCAKREGESEWVVTDSLSLNIADLPETFAHKEGTMSLAAYGLNKLVQDRNSSLSEKALSEMGLTGEAAQRARMDAYKETFDFLKGGEWTAKRKGGSSALDPILSAAIAELQNVSIVQAMNALKAMDKESRKAISELPAVKEVVDRLRAEGQDGGAALDLSAMIK